MKFKKGDRDLRLTKVFYTGLRHCHRVCGAHLFYNTKKKLVGHLLLWTANSR